LRALEEVLRAQRRLSGVADFNRATKTGRTRYRTLRSVKASTAGRADLRVNPELSSDIRHVVMS
jgi:hypothetical protein